MRKAVWEWHDELRDHFLEAYIEVVTRKPKRLKWICSCGEQIGSLFDDPFTAPDKTADFLHKLKSNDGHESPPFSQEWTGGETRQPPKWTYQTVYDRKGKVMAYVFRTRRKVEWGKRKCYVIGYLLRNAKNPHFKGCAKRKARNEVFDQQYQKLVARYNK